MNTQLIQTIKTNRAKKIAELKRRQEKREADGLYAPTAVEGEDYLICPITEVRFTKIKKGHITGTLAITEEEYYALFPELKGKVANRLKERIANGQKTKMAYDDQGNPVLDDNGKHMTSTQLARIKAHQTLNEVDPVTGKRRYDMLGEKTKNTHMSNLDEYGMNGYQRIAKDAIHKGNKTKAEKYNHRSYADISDKERYENIVDYFTHRCDTYLYTNGVKVKTRREGGEDCEQIDHMYSINEGFRNKISPICIAQPKNTQIIKAKVNEDKNDACCITKTTLFNLTNYTEEQSKIEFELFSIIVENHKKAEKYNSAPDVLQEMLDVLERMEDSTFNNSIEFIRYMLDKRNRR